MSNHVKGTLNCKWLQPAVMLDQSKSHDKKIIVNFMVELQRVCTILKMRLSWSLKPECMTNWLKGHITPIIYG